MKLSYCGRNGFLPEVSSGNRPVLSASPAGCIATEPLCILADFTLPQRIPCGLHLKWPFNRYVDLDFASAHPMRVASAKMHKIYSMDL